MTAKNFGVTEFVNPKDYDKPVQQVVAEITGGGVDRSIECSGNINSIVSAFEPVHDVSNKYVCMLFSVSFLFHFSWHPNEHI